MALVLRRALQIRELSGGAFDPGLGELTRLWGFSEDKQSYRAPDSSVIEGLRQNLIFSRDIRLTAQGDSAVIGLRSGALDLGGIAQGYAVDRAVAVLKAQGIRHALVNLTGEIGVLGVGANGHSWRVGVQHPRQTDRHIGVIELTEGTFVATSGDYERFFIQDGRRFHHILDPATGYPADRGAVGITILAGNCLDADAMATAAFVMGPQAGIEFLDSLGIKGLIVFAADGNTATGDTLDYRATESFLRLMQPDLAGQPLQ